MRTFPIQSCGTSVKSIPWGLIEPHEEQAQRNHSQTIQRLAERCGTCPMETVALLNDKRYHDQWPHVRDDDGAIRKARLKEAEAILLRRVEEYNAAHP